MGTEHVGFPHSTSRPDAAVHSTAWPLSLPFMVGIYAFLVTLYLGLAKSSVLRDGDTLWHIAAGRWILEKMAVPTSDPFSHSMPGSPWTAHEWLSEILLATAHQAAGFTGVVTLTGLAFAAAVALLARQLQRHFTPTRCILFAAMAVLMTGPHLLARPHILAMPLLVAWCAGLVHAADHGRAPSWHLVPLMAIWANMHGGFTLGIALAFAFTLETFFAARARADVRHWAQSWAIFLSLMLLASMATPHSYHGLVFTWQVLVQDSYALSLIGEWKSPDFHYFQPLILWLLGGLALVLYQGLRLPPMRLVLLLGFLYLSLKHVRNVDLLGLVVPLIIASSFSLQWSQRERVPLRPDRIQQWLQALPGRSNLTASSAIVVLALAAAWLIEQVQPTTPSSEIAPKNAVQAAIAAGARGPVLNGYGYGGYLIYSGIPVHIDGRSDMYRDAFIQEYVEAIELRHGRPLQPFLAKYRIGWTLLPVDIPLVTALDQLPGWKRIYGDDLAVVHMKVDE